MCEARPEQLRVYVMMRVIEIQHAFL